MEPKTIKELRLEENVDLEEAIELDEFFDRASIRFIGGASFTSSSINLLKTILGSGMLSMPAAIARIGYVPGTSSLLLTGSLCFLGLHLLLKATGPRNERESIATISRNRYLAIFADTAIVIKCIGVAASYLFVFGETSSEVLKLMPGLPSYFTQPTSLICFVLFPLIPLCFLKSIDALKYTSLGGLLAIVYLIILSLANYIREGAPQLDVATFEKVGWEYITCFPVFIFAFTCHQNILPIRNEAKKKELAYLDRITMFSLSLSASAYLLFSLVSCANFGKQTASNIFANYAVDRPEVVIARILFALLAAFSFPLQIFPSRISLISLLNQYQSAGVQVNKHGGEEQHSFYGLVTILLIFAAFVVAVGSSDLKRLLALIGTFAGIPICYFLPAFVTLLREQYNKAAIFLLFFGVFSFSVSIAGLLIEEK